MTPGVTVEYTGDRLHGLPPLGARTPGVAQSLCQQLVPVAPELAVMLTN